MKKTTITTDINIDRIVDAAIKDTIKETSRQAIEDAIVEEVQRASKLAIAQAVKSPTFITKIKKTIDRTILDCLSSTSMDEIIGEELWTAIEEHLKQCSFEIVAPSPKRKRK